ncbi:discoidin domain-containing protein [Xanthomonas sp. NCPPB 2654]|uniref:discoidin domain-containing protein n=1 Tax=unclassified Xanthomonas TaxID=2643310 RepID=UPI0021E0A22F|nr:MULTISPECIES: discoidin domain-containing protein [unclassified Xanthomonas]MDL5366402.1 discoidin domain-containing protein [Xanthomonas sp. NCPPB 2654]UYC22403.1 discoidin domain-containing protein [Xanthomonas sp. CFBP 8443]
MTSGRWLVAVLGLAAAQAFAAAPTAPLALDGFNNLDNWQIVVSNQVTASTRLVQAASGGRAKAICLDYDFNGVSGYAGIRRALPVEYPDNYQLSFQLRGDSPSNDLQFKLVDASGDNVWWVNRPRYDFPKQWTTLAFKKRQIDKAWGPSPDKELKRSAQIEFTIYNQVGGKGTVCFDQLALTPLPPQDTSPLAVKVSADTAPALEQRIADGKADTVWYSGNAKTQTVMLDLGKVREFGGAKLQWAPGVYASRYRLQGSADGRSWRELRNVTAGNGGTDWLPMPETEARYVRIDLEDGPSFRYGIADIALQPLAFAATPNDFVKSVAADSTRGWFPRGFSGEQPYWTIVGLDGGREQGLVGEDGAIEVGKGGFSIEPFLLLDGKRLSWADVKTAQSLQDDYLPIPSVDWSHDNAGLRITAFVQGTPEQAQLVARYRLSNPSKQPHDYTLALAVRPFQVNPPSQFLNTVGGVSPIHLLAFDGGQVQVNGEPRVFAVQKPDAAYATAFDAGIDVERLSADGAALPQQASDADGLASGALLYRGRLAPGEVREVALLIPQTGAQALPAGFDPAKAQQQVAAQWREKLDRVQLHVPAEGKALADTLRTALAHMLISRIGPRLQPGTRSYSRSWIRDGAMISEGLLRLGRADVAREYLEWYAPYQFANGMVPCCVDDRGSDPVPENDSHGELIFGVADYYRYSGDRAFLEKMWPHVLAAYEYMEQLRLSERTEENRSRNPAFYGMMPVSISHEGYSAKPMHSYWDNFWALRGYKDAVEIAAELGRIDDAARFAAARDEFRQDLYASLESATQQHHIDFLPGSAELGDFDPTSTTIALAPGGEQGRLPPQLLGNTFERYWGEFASRRDGKREWKDYTPYEWRNVAAFVRLGWRERAWDATQFFFKDRAPQPWNQWAEVVSRTPRKPFFVGDLPHAWVGSDFVRSVLDMFAYARDVDDSLVLAAGVPAAWFDGKGIAIQDLRTPQGELSYQLRRQKNRLTLGISGGLRVPSGGLVLPWPYPGEPGRTQINGEAAQWENGELRIRSLPADVQIEVR